jgi:hypothetical protein
MKLGEGEAHARLIANDHGVLSTVHSTRGVDVIPVVYSVDDHGRLGVPIDRVKAKSSQRLQRERNLEADPRAALLIEHWDRADWSRLWWVKAELRWLPDADTECSQGLADRLAERYPQYHDQPFTRLLVFDVVNVTGWAASG